MHGEKYDYSKVAYEAAKKKVIITCLEHGDFEQTPNNHYVGHGCAACGGNKPLSLENFAERANRIHENRYDYSQTKLENVEKKIEIICPEHGPFFQRPFNHLKGHRCPHCGWNETSKKLGYKIEQFLEEAKQAHGERYDYSKVKYSNALTKVTIICLVHGVFEQTPATHVRGVGCPQCGTESAASKRTRTTEDYVREAQQVHGDRYDYSKVKFITSHEKVEILCPDHGPFWQNAISHVRGFQSGCPRCAVSGFKSNLPGTLYYLAVTTDDGGTLYKIGITNLSVERRFSTFDLARIRIVKTWEFDVGLEALERETDILRRFAEERYFGPEVLESSGNTELFRLDVLGIDTEAGKQKRPVVDENATLFSRAMQMEFEF